jgi:hypothetical protein
MSRLRSWAFKIYGDPPPKGAPRSESLRWVRRFYVRSLPLTLLAYALLLVWATETWIFVLLVAMTLLWLQGVSSLSLRIRREEQRERS